LVDAKEKRAREEEERTAEQSLCLGVYETRAKWLIVGQ
jgi:hypothetical protein